MFVKFLFDGSLSLVELARFCGCAPCQILSANKKSERELIGQEILLPVSTPAMIRKPENLYYFVQEGEGKDELINRFFTPKITSSSFRSGGIIKIARPGRLIHIVKPMQTLSNISEIYGVNQNDLKSFNNIETCFIGQKIYVP